MQDTFNGVATKVGEVLISYAQQHGYSLVLDGGRTAGADGALSRVPPPTSAKEVIEAYNLKSGVPAPPAQPAAAAPQTRPQGACAVTEREAGV